VPQHYHADGSKGRAGGEEGADGAEQLRRVDPAIRVGVKGPLWRIDPQIESNGTADHHQEQESLRGEQCDAGADQGSHEQSAGGAGHRKTKALQYMGGLPDAGLHAGSF